MYAFRKPFSVAIYSSVPGWHFALDYKIALVLAQVLGYAASKMIGVKFIAEVTPNRRATAILVLIFMSWLALLLFAVVPAPWNVFAMFLNGLPLGLIWGLVFGFMEGRRTSEVLGAILCASFIVSSGAVKSVGKLLMDAWHISPFWMPAAAGAVFFPLLGLSVWGLSQLPPPSPRDEAERVRRAPMDAAARMRFLRATPFDIFGYSGERRTERQLIADYERMVTELIENLDAARVPLAAEIASIPEFIRGYGPVKARHLRDAKAREAQLLGQWRNPSDAAPTKRIPIRAAA